MEDNKQIVQKQPSIKAPGYFLDPPPGELSSRIELPFQWQVTSFGQIETLAQINIASSAQLAKVISNFRHAKILELTAVLTPTSSASSNPVTVDLCWVPANSSAAPSDIMNVYGGQKFTLGGPVTTNATITVACPLGSVNCMVKDSVLYTDTPKLLAYSSNSSSQTTPSATLQIRGRVLLSSPLLQPLTV